MSETEDQRPEVRVASSFLGTPIMLGSVVTWATYVDGRVQQRVGVVTKIEYKDTNPRGYAEFRVQIQAVNPATAEEPWNDVPDMTRPLVRGRKVSITNYQNLIVLTSYPSALQQFRQEVLNAASA